jgi:hypothetical protein
MAVESFVVVYDIKDLGEGTEGKTFTGVKASHFVAKAGLNSAKYALVEAESATEAIEGIKETFPGAISGKCVGVKLSSVTEA